MGRGIIASMVGNWMAGPNEAAVQWLKEVWQKKAHITGGTGTNDVASRNQCLAVDFY